ncbi:Anthranilate synthase component I-like protein, partial [Aduncisulcus paluster]
MTNFRDLALKSTRPSRPEPPIRRSAVVKSRVLANFPDVVAIYQKCFAKSPMSFWLDSSATIEGVSRYSILGSGEGPLAEFVSYRVSEQKLNARFAEKPDDLPFNFNLGYVGFLGYELKADLLGANAHTSRTVDAAMLFVDRAVVIDHELKNCYVLALAADDNDQSAELWMDAIAQCVESLTDSDPAPGEPPVLVPAPDV